MLLTYFNITVKHTRMSNHKRGNSLFITGEAGEMLEEKAVEPGYLPDELDVDRGLNKDPVTHYQFHEYV